MFYAGIDLGTSGCRISVINQNEEEQYYDKVVYKNPSRQTPDLWWDTVCKLIRNIPAQIRNSIEAISIDGTSGTLLLCDDNGVPTTPALMYNDVRAIDESKRIADIAPDSSGAHGAASSLSKLLYLVKKYPNKHHKHALHQADWISNKLIGRFGFSDENNCLKLGFDVIHHKWPRWLQSMNFPLALMPEVNTVGRTLGNVSSENHTRLKLSKNTKVVSGTTDSIAAFIAAGANEVGDAVTSLGSTLVIKLLSDSPIFYHKLGIYSHYLNGKWLVGGASNSGGNVLLDYFTVEEMNKMTDLLQPDKLLQFNYYPLSNSGERFPVADPEKQPKISPRPTDQIQFFQALLEGISDIEVLAYKTLNRLGGPYPKRILTVGGGSNNTAWEVIRRNKSGTKISKAKYQEASYGSAVLALQGIKEVHG